MFVQMKKRRSNNRRACAVHGMPFRHALQYTMCTAQPHANRPACTISSSTGLGQPSRPPRPSRASALSRAMASRVGSCLGRGLGASVLLRRASRPAGQDCSAKKRLAGHRLPARGRQLQCVLFGFAAQGPQARALLRLRLPVACLGAGGSFLRRHGADLAGHDVHLHASAALNLESAGYPRRLPSHVHGAKPGSSLFQSRS